MEIALPARRSPTPTGLFQVCSWPANTPAGLTPEATRQRLSTLVASGIECFIDLTHPAEIDPYDQELPFHVEYLRTPIRDHGLPERREHMMEILDCLHDALGSGRPAYVHCRAGIGRTGMVVGCLLVERGLTGEQALDELARLWQQSERSKFWPSVPETEAQSNYVRRWKPRKLSFSLAAPAAPPLGRGRRGRARSGRAGPTAGARYSRRRAKSARAVPRRLAGPCGRRCRRRRDPVPPARHFHSGRRSGRRRPVRAAARRLERRYRDGALSRRQPAGR